jgi:hypothetical protein
VVFRGAMADHRVPRIRWTSGWPTSFQGRRADAPTSFSTPVGGCEMETDTQRGMLPRILESATCVQRFDDSLNSAIRITYRISLRSSSLWEPRYPLLRVVFCKYNVCFSDPFPIHSLEKRLLRRAATSVPISPQSTFCQMAPNH